MKNNFSLLILSMFFSVSVEADNYYWMVGLDHSTDSSSPIDSCAKLRTSKGFSDPSYNFAPTYISQKKSYDTYSCHFDVLYTSPQDNSVWPESGDYPLQLVGDACPIVGQKLDLETGVCGLSISANQKGLPSQQVCRLAGDPINFTVGNLIESEEDYRSPTAMTFARTYNSLDGLWRHNYSTHVRFGIYGSTSVVVAADGKESVFSMNGQVAIPTLGAVGVLQKTDAGWSYIDLNNNIFSFDISGRLTEFRSTVGVHFLVNYAGLNIIIINDFGDTLTLTEDVFHQPKSMVANSVIVDYSYDEKLNLVSVTKHLKAKDTMRQYFYEDLNNSKLLTKVIDERGLISSIWSYDSYGRATSSERAGSVDKVLVSYNDDGSTTVTNELGKQTTYQYQTIQGSPYISKIQGEPSPNCPASNSSYTYNDRGQVLTKKDAKGFITTYTYNDRGLETSRTEASGTSLARTTTTTWDPSRFLRTQVVEPNRTTVYSYDAQGRQISQVVTPH